MLFCDLGRPRPLTSPAEGGLDLPTVCWEADSYGSKLRRCQLSWQAQAQYQCSPGATAVTQAASRSRFGVKEQITSAPITLGSRGSIWIAEEQQSSWLGR